MNGRIHHENERNTCNSIVLRYRNHKLLKRKDWQMLTHVIIEGDQYKTNKTKMVKKWNVRYRITQSCPTLCNPMDYSPPGSSVHEDSPGKNTGVGCHALLQGIIPTQRPNPGLPHCRWNLCHLSYHGSPNWPKIERIHRTWITNYQGWFNWDYRMWSKKEYLLFSKRWQNIHKIFTYKD